MGKRIIGFILFVLMIIIMVLPVGSVSTEELDKNALQLFLYKFASMDKEKREWGALILEMYITDSDDEIDELKDVIDTLITDDYKKKLEEYGYTVMDLKEELNRFKKWSLVDRKNLVKYIIDGEVLKVEKLILDYEDESLVMSGINFVDIENHWARTDIEFLANQDIIKGKSKDKFDPNGKITRAEFTSLVVRLFDLEIQSEKELPFNDIDLDDWFYKPIKAAYENGVISGIGPDTFGPNGDLTREQMIAIIIRILEKNEMFSRLNPVNLDIYKYKDKDRISQWAYRYMEKALEYGIISGRSDDILAPKDNTTRAEAAAIMMKLYDIIKTIDS